MSNPASLPLRDRFDGIMCALVRAVGSTCVVPWHNRFLPAGLVMLIYRRLSNVKLPFFAYLDRVLAGKARVRRTGFFRAARVATAEIDPTSSSKTPDAARSPREYPVPRKYMWLVRLVPDRGVDGCGADLERFVRDPEMAALIASYPRLGRLLRPLAHMLGLDMTLLPPPLPRGDRMPREDAAPRRRRSMAGARTRALAAPADGPEFTESSAYSKYWQPVIPAPPPGGPPVPSGSGVSWSVLGLDAGGGQGAGPASAPRQFFGWRGM